MLLYLNLLDQMVNLNYLHSYSCLLEILNGICLYVAIFLTFAFLCYHLYKTRNFRTIICKVRIQTKSNLMINVILNLDGLTQATICVCLPSAFFVMAIRSLVSTLFRFTPFISRTTTSIFRSTPLFFRSTSLVPRSTSFVSI